MHIVQISDLHLTAPDKWPMQHLDLQHNTAATIAAIKRAHAANPVAAVLVTGDITDDDPTAYALVQSLVIEPLKKAGIPCYPVTGNHDNRQALIDIWAAAGAPLPLSQDRLNYTVTLDNWRLIMLDAAVSGQHHGQLTEPDVTWLRQQLQEAKQAKHHVMLVTHFPPCLRPHALWDSIRLFYPPALEVLAQEYQGSIKAMVCGHWHCDVSGTWNGIPVHVGIGIAPEHNIVTPRSLIDQQQTTSAILKEQGFPAATWDEPLVVVGYHPHAEHYFTTYQLQRDGTYTRALGAADKPMPPASKSLGHLRGHVRAASGVGGHAVIFNRKTPEGLANDCQTR